MTRTIKFWPDIHDIRPQLFLLFGLGYWLVAAILSLAWLGYSMQANLIDNGKYINVLNCTDSQPQSACTSYQFAGEYYKQTSRNDLQAAAIVVGVFTVVSYANHVLTRLRDKHTKHKDTSIISM